MKIYVGYILGDYAHALYIGKNRDLVQKSLNKIKTNRTTWIEEYTIPDNKVIELDCD